MALEIHEVFKTYQSDGVVIPVLLGASLDVSAGEVVRLHGPSGSGKSTLMYVAGLLAHPEKGEVVVAGVLTGGLTDQDASRLRATELGFVFQAHNLLPHLTALENVMLPCLLSPARSRARALELLQRVGLSERTNLLAGRLSGGEQQRVALARALVNQPTIILADEPTAGLDDAAATDVLRQLRAAANDGHAVLVASHDVAVSGIADRVLSMRGGQVVVAPVEESPRPTIARGVGRSHE